MYTRKHHKEDSSIMGTSLRWKYTFSIDDKGEEIYHMQRTEVEYDEPIPIYFDNISSISILKNPMMHSKTKNIPIKYHFLRE
jgi:hypothetical protein